MYENENPREKRAKIIISRIKLADLFCPYYHGLFIA